MADPKKPIEEVSAEDAQALFASAAKALGGSEGRSAGFRRVSIPVSEPIRPEPLPKTEPKPEPAAVIEPEVPVEVAPTKKKQSKRKAWYLRKRKEEEEESIPISKEKQEERRTARAAAEEAAVIAATAEVAEAVSADVAEDDYEEEYHARRSTPVIPSAVVFDYYEDEEDDYDDYDDDYEPTQEDIEEEASFSALEAALGRHKQMYGDNSRKRGNRYHDYGFGMGISFDGLDDYDDDDE